ncbi:MAG TPA: MliC family protein [Candidatus Paceibacterota bacterium]|nr:MliC family protein [Candidatus Paceibacterota bacterium]
MTIEWKKVTWYSQALAIILFIGVFAFGYWLGAKQSSVVAEIQELVPPQESASTDASYLCADEKGIIALYAENEVVIMLSDGRTLTLPQTIAASGIRYANEDESIVFWSKGETAFLEENGAQTYAECSENPLPI